MGIREGLMPSYCKECKEKVGWGVKTCPFCGEYNPTGMNTELLGMLGVGTAVVLFLLFAISKGMIRFSLAHLF
jgi:hypothetical protein